MCNTNVGSWRPELQEVCVTIGQGRYHVTQNLFRSFAPEKGQREICVTLSLDTQQAMC